jgi:DnaK suppressor protein
MSDGKEMQKVLKKELEEARKELRRVEAKLESEVDYELGEGDPRLYEWEMNLALKEQVSARIKSLKEALGRLKEGKYGLCRVCGGQIDPERLKVLPQTDLCIKCARKGAT